MMPDGSKRYVNHGKLFFGAVAGRAAERAARQAAENCSSAAPVRGCFLQPGSTPVETLWYKKGRQAGHSRRCAFISAMLFEKSNRKRASVRVGKMYALKSFF